MTIAKKSAVVREAIGWFVGSLVANLVVLIVVGSIWVISALDWVIGAGVLLCFILSVAFVVYGVRKEIRRQVERGVRPDPKGVVHPFFGKLDAECSGDPDDQWHGEIPFPPIADTIGVTIIASYDGPTQQQVEFTNWVRDHFGELVASLDPVLREDYNASHKSAVQGSLLDEFTLSSITVPQDGDMRNEWEIAFTSRSDPEHVFAVLFENGKPSGIHMD